jgi:trans-2,3-dihydro-3-hydroxyanthranilate isomerase
LIKHRYFGKSYIDLLRVEQGFCIGRPSLIYISAKETPKEIDVRIGGKVVMVAEGRFV